MISIGAVTMEVILTETALIDVIIGELEYADSVFHATAPIPFIFGPSKKVIPSIAMYLIVNKYPIILLPITIIVCPPPIFLIFWNLPFIVITIIVSNFDVSVCQFLSRCLCQSSVLLVVSCLLEDCLLCFVLLMFTFQAAAKMIWILTYIINSLLPITSILLSRFIIICV